MKSNIELMYNEIRHIVGSSCKVPEHLNEYNVKVILDILKNECSFIDMCAPYNGEKIKGTITFCGQDLK